MEPALWPAVVLAATVVALAVAVLWALAVERPDPAETALAYEEAWDRHDFDLLWRLSGPELRDGRSRDGFVAAKGELYRERADLSRLVERVEIRAVESAGRLARIGTRLGLRDGAFFDNEMLLRREGNRWAVVGYRLGRGHDARQGP